jgi:Protein of unknown function (DUF3800)
MCALIIGQPCPAERRSMIFCDESSQKERFFVLGALYFAFKADSDHVANIALMEKQMRDVKAKHGLFGRVKWEKVPAAQQKNKLEGYKAVIKMFTVAEGVRFKCMVLDTNKYPLDNRVRWRGDALVGYLKFYCVFLSDGIMVRHPGHFYDITIDNYTFREGCDSDDLRMSVEGRYVNKTKKNRLQRHCDLSTANEEDSNLLQLTDLLTGAVAFCWNGGKLRNSGRAASKKQLVELLESKFNISLDRPRFNGRFGIWEFSAKP